MGLLLGGIYRHEGGEYALVRDVVTTDLDATEVSVRFDPRRVREAVRLARGDRLPLRHRRLVPLPPLLPLLHVRYRRADPAGDVRPAVPFGHRGRSGEPGDRGLLPRPGQGPIKAVRGSSGTSIRTRTTAPRYACARPRSRGCREDNDRRCSSLPPRHLGGEIRPNDPPSDSYHPGRSLSAIDATNDHTQMACRRRSDASFWSIRSMIRGTRESNSTRAASSKIVPRGATSSSARPWTGRPPG